MRRLLDLVEKTGDKVIVTDPTGEHPYVLMSLGQYELLMLGKEASIRTPEPASVPSEAQKMPAKREIPLWKIPAPAPTVSPAVERPPAKPAPLRSVLKTPPPKPAQAFAAVMEEAGLAPEGEEQFYLEPLE